MSEQNPCPKEYIALVRANDFKGADAYLEKHFADENGNPIDEQQIDNFVEEVMMETKAILEAEKAAEQTNTDTTIVAQATTEDGTMTATVEVENTEATVETTTEVVANDAEVTEVSEA